VTSRLTIEVEGLRSDRGHVIGAIYDTADQFPEGSACRSATVAIARGAAAFAFDSLPPGSYAVGLFHDENDNGRLDKNFLGIPTEGVGLSGYDKLRLELPTFANAAFRYSGGEQTVKVKVHYLL
jgi:uncharacterized protein (DUF2141 family)